MIDWTKPVRRVMGLGSEVKVLTTEASGRYPVVLDEGDGNLHVTTLGGMTRYGDTSFENIPPKREVWVNVYMDGAFSTHIDRHHADAHAAGNARDHVIRLDLNSGETVKESAK
jgi:hypothetical protein